MPSFFAFMAFVRAVLWRRWKLRYQRLAGDAGERGKEDALGAEVHLASSLIERRLLNLVL